MTFTILKIAKMEIPILFSLIFLTSCIVPEARGARDQIPEETTQTQFSGVSKNHNGGVHSSGYAGDSSSDQEDSPFSSFSSFPPLNRFSSFRLSPPFASRSFNGNDPSSLFANSPFNAIEPRFQKLTQITGLPSNNKNGYFQKSDNLLGNRGAPLIGANYGSNTLSSRRYPSEKSALSVNQDDGFQNGDLSISNTDAPPVGAFGTGFRLFSQHYPSGKQSVMDSIFNQIQMPALNGLQPTNQGNGNGNRNQQLGKINTASTKNIIVDKFGSGGMKGFRVQMQETRCCIDNKCFSLKAGEVCGFKKQLTNGKNNKQQYEMSNNPPQHLMSSASLSDDEDSRPGSKISSGQYSFGEHSLSDGAEYILSNDGLDSYKPKSGPLNHPDVRPIGLSEEEAEKIRNFVHKQHNFYRSKHGMPELTLNKQLSNYAQDWANTLANADMMTHRDSNVYGENIFHGTEIENVGKESVDSFYNEIALYRPGDTEQQISDNNPVHHLTQILWNLTNTLGVGVSKSRDGQYFIVCNYDPAGNVYPFYKKNLPEITQAQVDEGVDKAKENKKKNGSKITFTRKLVQSPVYKRSSSGWTEG